MISLFVRRFFYFFRIIDSLCGEFIRFFVIFVFSPFLKCYFLCLFSVESFFHGVLGRRSSGFDPDVVLVVYFFAHGVGQFYCAWAVRYA